MEHLSTLNTTEPIDYDNLKIITRPRPPRRRQSEISLIPFRPYVKCLTSVRELFSFTDGENEWKTTGTRETFFEQPNARCIGSLMDDCDISDTIRWDIEEESTRLPMVCKLWIIVDGAVVERGKPHLVQDAAIQVNTAGRSYRSILEAEQRHNQVPFSTHNRHRRHSWHDVNEYHSVSYYQYSRSVRSGCEKGIQCNMDDGHVTSTEEFLSSITEETVDEKQISQLEKYNAKETIHNQSIPQNRVQISIMTQTEHQFIDQSTETDPEFIHLYNLNLQTNEHLLSSTVNPYTYHFAPYYSSNTIKTFHNSIEYTSQSVSTGDDYPQWWLQLSTSVILSDHITNQGEEKKKVLLVPSPKQLDQSSQTHIEDNLGIEIEKPQASSTPRQFDQSNQTNIEDNLGIRIEKERLSSSPRRLDQSNQTNIEDNLGIEIEKLRPLSSSSRIQKSSSTMTLTNNYEIIDQINDGNNSRRLLSFHNEGQRFDSDSHLSDYQIETSSNCESCRLRYRTISKQSEPDYNTFRLALNQRSNSTPDPHNNQSIPSSNETTPRTKTKTSQSTSPTILATLLERYERTLRERQKAIAIVNDELLDIDDVLKRYRKKIENPEKAIQLYQDIKVLSAQAKEENPSSSLSLARLTKTKYRRMPNITSEEMLQGYIPSPRMYITNSSRQRQPRFDYCDLCLTDNSTSSAWIRYNEQRIDQLQKRFDLMLQIDDMDGNQLFSSSDTVTQRINDILTKNPKRRNQLTSYHTRILLPHRYDFHLPYRLTQSLPSSPRLLTRSTKPISKSVRISTNHNQKRLHQPSSKTNSQPIVSILRRNRANSAPCSHQLVDESHIWKNESDGKIYILKQFSIPRYYRLYNDVSFREIYNFSHILQSYLNQTTPKTYSSIVKNFAVEQQLPTVTSVA